MSIENGKFTSVWDSGYEVTTDCKIDMDTKQVFDIAVTYTDDLNVLDYEYITVNGEDYPVFTEEERDETEKVFWY